MGYQICHIEYSFNLYMQNNGVYMWLPGTTVRYFIVGEKRKLIELGEGDPGFHPCSAITCICFLVSLLDFWNLNTLPWKTDSTPTDFFFNISLSLFT